MKKALTLLAGTMLALTAAAAEKLNINTADAEAFDAMIKGVGAKKAMAIIEYREKHGPFKTVEDLAKVRGVTLDLVERHRGLLGVE